MATEPTDDTPLVSVVITTYNRPSYLQAAVESVGEQTYEPIELVVVDDHSTTPARDVLSDQAVAQFHQFQCVRHEENRGANAARNTGIEASSGEFIAFLDDDDRWKPTKIQRQVERFQQDDDIGVVYTGLTTIYEGERGEERPPEVENMTKALLCRNVVGSPSAVMVRTAVARETPLDERFPCWADLEWYVNLSTKTRFERIPEPLVIYEFDSHNRLSDDFEKTRTGYELFTTEFDELAGTYGRLFRRKMHGWAAFRAGAAALNGDRYRTARQFLTTALIRYPFEPRFVKYALATAGGRYTHGLARGIKSVLS